MINGMVGRGSKDFAGRACNLKVVDKGLDIVYGEACFKK